MRQHKVNRRKLRRLIIVLKCLIVIALDVERSGQLIAAFGAHRFVLRIVECVQSEMLHLLVVFLEEEMIGQMIEHHGIGRVDGVRLGQHLDAHAIRFGFVEIELGDGQTDEGADAVRVEFEGSLEG